MIRAAPRVLGAAPRLIPATSRRCGRSRLVFVLAALALALSACAMHGGGEGEPLVIAAASDLRPALPELEALVAERTEEEPTVVVGSSGQLAQQLIEGSPMDVLASADRSYVDRVLEAGRGDPDTVATYAVGRLALWSPVQAWGGWTDPGALVADPDVTTIALANPDHAPYGRAASEALASSGNESLEGRLVYGENIADAQRIGASGNADAVLTALPLAIAAGDDGRWNLVDDALHQPLQQTLVVTADGDARVARAQDVADVLLSDEAGEILRTYGLAPPGLDPPESWQEP